MKVYQERPTCLANRKKIEYSPGHKKVTTNLKLRKRCNLVQRCKIRIRVSTGGPRENVKWSTLYK